MSSVNFNKLQKRIRRLTATAIEQFHLIEDGDRIMVCLSGGKDSYAMLDMLLALKIVAPVRFEVFAINLDQKQPGFDESILPRYLEKCGVEYYIIEEDTYSIVKDKIPEGKTMCSLCSRLRRGILYNFAKEKAATKIALGHHKDDILETYFLNLFFGGSMKTMPPKLVSDDGENTVIRPLALVDESDLIKYAEHKQYPIIPCNLCGSQENLQRKHIKRMLADWERAYPNRKASIFKAISNIHPSHLLDRSLFDFAALATEPTETKSWLMPQKSATKSSATNADTSALSDEVLKASQLNEIPIVFRPNR